MNQKTFNDPCVQEYLNPRIMPKKQKTIEELESEAFYNNAKVRFKEYIELIKAGELQFYDEAKKLLKLGCFSEKELESALQKGKIFAIELIEENASLYEELC